MAGGESLQPKPQHAEFLLKPGPEYPAPHPAPHISAAAAEHEAAAAYNEKYFHPKQF